LDFKNLLGAINFYPSSFFMKRLLGNALSKALSRAYNLPATAATTAVNISKAPGVDYADTTALKLSKSLATPPHDIATSAIAHLPSSLLGPSGPFGTVKATEKGFLHISVGDEWLYNQVVALAENGPQFSSLRTASSLSVLPQRIVVDFASPNVGKQLHAGHLRSSVIGDTIARILEYQGHDVLRLSHVGDVGLPVALLVAHGIDMNVSWMLDENVNLPSTEELSALYVAAKARSKDDTLFHASVLSTLNVLQNSGSNNSNSNSNSNSSSATHTENSDNAVTFAWKRVKEASRIEHESAFDRLGVHVQERAESTYTDQLESVVEELLETNIATISQGATCVFPVVVDVEEDKVKNQNKNNKKNKNKNEKKKTKDSPPPMLVRKSDGSWLYATIDIACVRQRLMEEKADRVVYVTDEGQRLHFLQVFDVAKRATWTTADEKKSSLQHVGFGLVKDETGNKLSSRDGDALPLNTLLNRATEEAKKALERTEDVMIDAGDGKNMLISEAVGISALRYYDLRAGRKSYKLNFTSMLTFRGNTSVYLQYALTRIKSIQRKVMEKNGTVSDAKVAVININMTSLPTAVERKLALELVKFDDVIETTSNGLSPHLMCEYLYGLAKIFHAFYEECRVSGDEHEQERMLLLRATEQVLGTGMKLLGVVVLDRM